VSAPAPPERRPPERRRPTSARVEVPRRRRVLKLRHLLFLLLLLSGIVPLVISSNLLIRDNIEVLKTQQQEILTYSAQSTADALSERLTQRKDQLRQLGRALLSYPGYATIQDRLRSEWAKESMWSYIDDHPEIYAFHVADQTGLGWRVGPETPPERIERAMTDAFHEALRAGTPAYRFVILSPQETGVVIAVPLPAGEETMVARSLVRLSLENLTAGAGTGDIEKKELFLIDAQGELLWSPGSREEIEAALLASELVSDFVKVPVSVTTKLDLEVGGATYPTLARVVQVRETGWGVVAHKPYQQAFESVDKMVRRTVYSSVVLVVLALVAALLAARWLSQPIQQLVQASHDIAAGNFDRRVKTRGLAFEIADLAEDFNRMSDTVESYVDQLRRAAEANRELFISTIRAFAATIDAKDPYTRGHSERVAAYSRSIARYLGLAKDAQEKVWISAVLHDVGKIGVDDRILKKVGVLTPEEFEQMKLHPVIGADIVEPISALREMIPGIRWHHEAWNGTGYPDNLKGEQIPLMARVIGVADTFDAITTTRPYQNAYSTDYAIQTIKKLTGKRFDPKIVKAFLLAYEAGNIKVDKQEADSVTSKIRITTPEAVSARA
jgi:HD-GYP domain-containing protein (c-di-GMP phosphodiesterase class II)